MLPLLRIGARILLTCLVIFLAWDRSSVRAASALSSRAKEAQAPSWTPEDLEFFLHGSMSTEFVPETILRAFVRTYPQLFPGGDFRQFGLLPDEQFGWPIGFSRAKVPHLAGLPSVGINCASCHVGDVSAAPGRETVRVLGMTSQFDAEAFFGAVIGATFQTAVPDNFKRFLQAYLEVADPKSGTADRDALEREWQKQERNIIAALAGKPEDAGNSAPGPLYSISANSLRLDHRVLQENPDLAALAGNLMKLFHNMRASLHVPDQPPASLPPASGPGRNDAFGLLSAVLFGVPQPYAPVKYGLVWNVASRHWVHWDGNTRSPIGRNLLASLGLGAPLLGHKGQLDFALVNRQTDISERILPPKYPFEIDRAAAERGKAHYQARCASCHDGNESDARLYAVSEIGTEPHRAVGFTQAQADRFNQFLAELETPGYSPSSEPGIRGTGKYWAATLAGVWARSPYLHNGSVRTMRQLLSPAGERADSFHRGTSLYDSEEMGYANAGNYLLETAKPGNSNSGHEFGTDLGELQKHELIEFLKTL